ncbi:hypothetical protein JQ582_42010 [Bradyrhizobium japonicum]|uniref:glycine-rich domain-containing protein n=1 Tax=Bradyrhizobium TaxID=374 RepID=UPI001BA93F73|nr:MULTISPECIES: hypothetical protein [Bradyrhizobium]MBR0734528.1 hypothetical protein [Bradyrhizobium japonicum]MBR0750474.1 hypothetical protein [Bradyrhizobium japonicum]MDI3559994.1 hypothetical protein [Bradyrhizobium sp. Arg816]
MSNAPIDQGSLPVFSYEAPFLIEKLLKDHVAETTEEADALFREVKRYIVLTRSDRTKIWSMHSLRIDEAWHQFILFTTEYGDFCQRYFGSYVHHCPSNAPKSAEEKTIETASWSMFRERYIQLFGSPPPDLWNDANGIRPTQRVMNDDAGELVTRDADGMINLLSQAGDVLISVNEIARPALNFAAQTSAFYVRELPGNLDDDEKVALVAALMRCNVLRVAW